MNTYDDYNDIAAERMAMTYGMSDELLQSDLLQRISRLSKSDKQCLIRYITEDVEVDSIDEDVWDQQDTSALQPYTTDELYARIQESEEQISRGEYLTEEEVRKKLKQELIWLNSMDYACNSHASQALHQRKNRIRHHNG